MQLKINHRILGLAILLALAPGLLQAGEWGLGIGVAAQRPPQEGTDDQVVILPFPSYQGDRLRLDFGSVGFALTTSEKFRVELEGALRFDGYDPDDSDALTGLARRDLTFDAGASVTTAGAWGSVGLQFMVDALGVHEGYELSATYQYPIQWNRLSIVPFVSAKWASAELVEYYYGVRLEETTLDRPEYSGDAVLNLALGMNLGFALASNWELIGGFEYTRLGTEITDSPIIARDHEVIMYSAIVYRF